MVIIQYKLKTKVGRREMKHKVYMSSGTHKVKTQDNKCTWGLSIVRYNILLQSLGFNGSGENMWNSVF